MVQPVFATEPDAITGHMSTTAFVCRLHRQQASTVDVAIVGGGLGGLITAVALRQALPNASVQVKDTLSSRRPEPTEWNQTLGLFSTAPTSACSMTAVLLSWW